MIFGKKRHGFTLIEMLIVIVIIGVLAAALIPRLVSVRGRANDVARKADLQQIATAVVSYSLDKSEYPVLTGNSVAELSGTIATYLTTIPRDPVGTTSLPEYENAAGSGLVGTYAYVRVTKGGTSSAGFAIIAKMETEGGANRIYDTGVAGAGAITGGVSVETLTPCTKMTKAAIATTGSLSDKDNCIYGSTDQLRYIIVR